MPVEKRMKRLGAWMSRSGGSAGRYAARRWERRHRHRITLEGVIFVAIAFLIGLAAFNTGTNLLYLICSMLLSFLVLSGVVSANSLRGLELKRSAPRQAIAGEPCRVQIAVRNQKRWSASFSLRVVDRLDDGGMTGAVFVASIPRRGVAHASYRTLFRTRGLYILKKLHISSRFPFGLMERSWATTQPHEILVYPRLVDVRPILQQAETTFGDTDSHRKGQGTSLYQLREYTGMESARSIHWKTSAHTRRLMVKEFEREEKRRVTVYLNNAATAEPTPELRDRFERALVLASSLIKYLLETDHQTQLITGSGKVPFGSGMSHVHRCLRALAGMELFMPERHPFHLPPPEADSVNVFIHYDPGRRDSIYTASAVVFPVERWWDLLNPVAEAPGDVSAPPSSRSGGGRGPTKPPSRSPRRQVPPRPPPRAETVVGGGRS